jgi:hypothetical protein
LAVKGPVVAGARAVSLVVAEVVAVAAEEEAAGSGWLPITIIAFI